MNATCNLRVFAFFVLTLSNLPAWTQPVPDAPSDLLVPDPASNGYTVDNFVPRFKVHKVLPQRMNLDVAGSIDSRYQLANLRADEVGNYEVVPNQKVLVVDRQTGDAMPTPYVGSIQCFANGNLAIYIKGDKSTPDKFMYGKYGEELTEWEGLYHSPQNIYWLNKMSCVLQPKASIKRKVGPSLVHVYDLLVEHGTLQAVDGAPRPSNTPDIPDAAKALMQRPFMQGMQVLAPSAQWYLVKPNGDEVWIPNNPGETLGQPKYIPHLGAYFTSPGLRSMLPDSKLLIPVFARLIYPDGKVERFSVPDVIRIPREKNQLGFRGVSYTKAGLVWHIEYSRFGTGARTTYRGELEEGYYLQKTSTKTLVKLPDLNYTAFPTGERYGCIVSLNPEVAQRKPVFLLNNSYINICTGE